MKNPFSSKVSTVIASFFVLLLIFQCKPANRYSELKIVWKKIENDSIPIPPLYHPRLYLKPSEAKEMGKRLKEPVLQPVVDKLRTRSNQTLQLKVEWDAVQYLATEDKVLGRKTIDSTLALLKRTELPDIGDAARVTGRMMVTGAIVYDWLYSLLTSEEKNEFIQEFVRLAKTLECGYPPTKQGSVTGHSSESFIMRDMLSAGIAIYDEYPEMYEVAAERFYREFLPARNWLYNGHAYHQGDSYGPLRFSWDTYPLMIFDKMGVENIYNPEQQYVPYFYIYTTRPDGQRMRAGDTYLHANHGAPPGHPWSQYSGTLYTASYYNDGILLDQFLRQGGATGEEHGRTNQHEYIFQFLWWDTSLNRLPVSTLPLSKYFGPPFGWMVARTGWDEESVIAEMKINEYNFNNHQHMDAGSFQIYYKGPLATESGLYGGTSGGYGSPHCKNYFWRSIAHNTLLIYDPAEQFSPDGTYANDGGQRLPNKRYEPTNLEVLLDPDKGYKTGDIIAYGIGPEEEKPDYSYLKGDITKAYSTKVEEVKRSFVFLNLHDSIVPASLVIFDKVVSASPDFRKYWLMHSIKEPLVSHNEYTIVADENEEMGKLVNTTLLPEFNDLKINTIGGPGREFWVFGTNYENEPTYISEHTYERAAWRIELSPEVFVKENYFLNVMQIMENKNEKLIIKKIVGSNVIGSQISDRIILFSKNSDEIGQSVEFEIHDEGAFKILLTDLQAGDWNVLRNNVLVSSETVKKGEGVIYFNGEKGEYSITKNNN